MVRNYWGEAVFSRETAQEPVSTVAHDTFYRTHGDIFALACAALSVLFGAFAFYRKGNRPKPIGNVGKKAKKTKVS
jgi:apolipoprotein N-acyltransferase